MTLPEGSDISNKQVAKWNGKLLCSLHDDNKNTILIINSIESWHWQTTVITNSHCDDVEKI